MPNTRAVWRNELHRFSCCNPHAVGLFRVARVGFRLVFMRSRCVSTRSRMPVRALGMPACRTILVRERFLVLQWVSTLADLCRVASTGSTVLGRQLAGEQRGAGAVAILEDLRSGRHEGACHRGARYHKIHRDLTIMPRCSMRDMVHFDST
jgi:hypothetical protein